MTEEAGIAKLWQGFHQLSENNKDLVLTITKAIGHSEQDSQAISKQTVNFYDSVSRKGDEQ